ncbi:MAG TPA: hypothetical protein VES73_17600, partial [Lamprocystis sp. (in: g-proteobacteria)]|nr:hypothetical protein [Lamprocystis sp. (in: g-proteobacteria)]
MVREAKIDGAALAGHPILDALAKYTELLHKKRFLDYSMLLTEAVHSLATPGMLRDKMSERVKYLI